MYSTLVHQLWWMITHQCRHSDWHEIRYACIFYHYASNSRAAHQNSQRNSNFWGHGPSPILVPLSLSLTLSMTLMHVFLLTVLLGMLAHLSWRVGWCIVFLDHIMACIADRVSICLPLCLLLVESQTTSLLYDCDTWRSHASMRNFHFFTSYFEPTSKRVLDDT